MHIYQLGFPLDAETLVTMGLLPKGEAKKTLPPDAMATEGDPKPYPPSESV